MKNLIIYTFDLETQNLPKVNEKPFKIYTAKTLNNSTDYIIMGTNKGIVILKYNEYYKPDIIENKKLIDLNNNEKLFAYMTSSGNNIYELNINLPYKTERVKDKKDLLPKFTSLIPMIFDSKLDNLSKKIKIQFSFDGVFMSIVNLFSQSYAIYNLDLNENLKFSPNTIKIGKGIDVVWCKYDNYFAVVSNSENSSNKGNKEMKSYFSLSVYNIISSNDVKRNFNVKNVYTLNE
jgi:hypothetical protein